MVTGVTRSPCRGRLGNQLGVLALGLQLFLKYGVKMVIDKDQERELSTTFEIEKTCNSQESSFCMVASEGKFGINATALRYKSGYYGKLSL